MIIRPAQKNDETSILSIFDIAVKWLTDKGLSAQWGTESFSEKTEMISKVQEWINQGNSYVAIINDTIVGFISLVRHPPAYVGELHGLIQKGSFYIASLVTDRHQKGLGIGTELLHFAEALAEKKNHKWIYLDCWNGESSLIGYYEKAGFKTMKPFFVGTWKGVLMKKPLLGNAVQKPNKTLHRIPTKGMAKS